MAERVGFEPTCRLRDKTLSRRPRYDHFGTSPFIGARGGSLSSARLSSLHRSRFVARSVPLAIGALDWPPPRDFALGLRLRLPPSLTPARRQLGSCGSYRSRRSSKKP